MILKSSTVIEYNNFYFNDAIFKNEANLAIFWLKNNNKSFMSHKELHNIKMQGTEGVLIIQTYWYLNAIIYYYYCIVIPYALILSPRNIPNIKLPNKAIVDQNTSIIISTYFSIVIL